MSNWPLITILTLVPLVGGAIVMGLGSRRGALARGVSLACSFAALALGVWMATQFNGAVQTFQFEERCQWIRWLAVDYRVAVDGLGLLMVLLTVVLTPMAILASWAISDRPQLYFGLVLWLEAGLIGTFTALNFFHWFLFWELSLIPAFFLVRLWGGPRRVEAANRFFLYTMAGSVALLLAFLAIFLSTRQFDFVELARLGREGTLTGALSDTLGWRDLTTRRLALMIFAGALLGFAVKTPLMPFHSWLPLAYAEAPTGTAMLLTGAMSKMGMYGFLRILVPIFPQEMHWLATPLLWLAVITIVVSAGAAVAQRDLKRMLAWSSVNHLGYCLLGTFAVFQSGAAPGAPLQEKSAALSGVMLQMFNHGLTAATLFWCVGLLEQRGGGLRGIDDFGGLRKAIPVFCGLMGIALFSSLGLPGLNSFVGEFLIFKGVFPLASWAAALSVLGLLLTAFFLLTALQRVFNGPLNERWAQMPDLTTGQRFALAGPIALMFVLGIYPQALLGLVSGTVAEMVSHLRF